MTRLRSSESCDDIDVRDPLWRTEKSHVSTLAGSAVGRVGALGAATGRKSRRVASALMAVCERRQVATCMLEY